MGVRNTLVDGEECKCEYMKRAVLYLSPLTFHVIILVCVITSLKLLL